MSRRPDNLDLSGVGFVPNDLASPRNRFHLDMPSPRVGDVPPALSPLDAFAQQSRALAKKFDESQQKGRRISRLDHLEVASEFGRRPNFFRGLPTQAEMVQDEQEEDEVMPLPNVPVKHQTPVADRPMSQYPVFGLASEEPKRLTTTSDIWFDAESSQKERDGYFGVHVPRADSPEPFDGKTSRPVEEPSAVPSLSGSVDSLQSSQPRTNTDDSTSSRRYRTHIAPASPSLPIQQRSLASVRSMMNTNVDDELVPPRKFSASSHSPRAPSPFTPEVNGVSRSPSIMSDHSAFQEEFRRPSFNFSRPLSSSGNKDLAGFRPPLSQTPSYDSRPSYDITRERSPLRQDSGSSRTTQSSDQQDRPNDDASQSGDDSMHRSQVSGNGAPSYIYAKYSLPRGRTVERNSQGERASWIQNQFKWEEPTVPNIEPSPILPSNAFDRPYRPHFTSDMRSQSADARGFTTPQFPMHRSSPSSPSVHSSSTDRTIRAHTKNSASQEIVNMTPEQHLEKGIECHSEGSLSKSTYHLRHAARAGHPTGMLLYALACRHGWGMRANQAEGVSWLKKAVDSSSLEMLEESDVPVSQALPGQSTKSRKAQFALAIYELGMSYMNGWGTPRDRGLALRCFEVAGSWGDCDALAEAGFCYTEGVGCRKDLKKAAGFYRRAAEGGMSMAGNSWIYKAKYMDELAPSSPSMKSPNPSNSDRSAKGGRARARSIFGRKKSYNNV